MTPTIVSSIAMYPHERTEFKSLFENPRKVLTSKCQKNDKNPHDCVCMIYYKWETPIIYIWTHGQMKECAFRGRDSTNRSCNVNVWTTSYSALTILGFVHVNFVTNFFILCSFNGLGWLCFCPFFCWCLLGHCHIWLQTCYFPVRLRLIPRPEKLLPSLSMLFVMHWSSSCPFDFPSNFFQTGVCGTRIFL